MALSLAADYPFGAVLASEPLRINRFIEPMLLKPTLAIMFTASLLSACATISSSDDQSIDDRTPLAAESDPVIEEDQAELVASLPASIESFELTGARAFDVEGDGVNVRYSNSRKRRRADVFVYPVAESNKSLTHPDLVLGSTQATGTIARVQATYLRENLASYTVVYQTEHDGTMVKIRLTMPDNKSNRESREWDRFVDEVLNSVTDYLDLDNQTEAETAAI